MRICVWMAVLVMLSGGMVRAEIGNIAKSGEKSAFAASEQAEEVALHAAMATALPPRVTGAFSLRTADGLSMVVDRAGIVRHVAIRGQDLPAPEDSDFGGFWAWDISRPAKFFRFEAAGGSGKTLELRCEPLGLRLTVRVRAAEEAVIFDGELADERGQDRGVVLVWAMPLDAAGWQWAGNFGDGRAIKKPGRYEDSMWVGRGGATGRAKMSVYPWAAVASDKIGLLVCRPMDQPRLAAFFYDFGQQRFVGVRFYLGLSPAAGKFPSRASFSFALSALPRPQWGFRAACRRYYQLFGQAFTDRAKLSGICLIGEQLEAEAKGAGGLNEVGEGIWVARKWQGGVKPGKGSGGKWHKIVYSEPAVLWFRSEAAAGGKFGVARFVDELIEKAAKIEKVAEYPEWARGAKISEAEMARAALNSYVGTQGRPWTWMKGPGEVAVNCDGDPELKQPSRASLWLEYEAAALNGQGVEGVWLGDGGIDGLAAAEDFRREHWAVADFPLVASFATGRCAELAGAGHRELYEVICRQAHGQGKVTIARLSAAALGLCGDLFDGFEVRPGGNGVAAIRRLATWRAIAYHRPLWQVVRGGDEDEIRRGIQQGIVYCAWPVVEDAGGKTAAAVAKAWQELGPIFEALSQAGWEPIPYAYAWPRDVVVERYGELRGKIVYLVVYNSASRPVMAQIAVGGLASPLQRRAVDLVSGQKLRIGHGKISMPLEPGQVAVFKLHVPVSG